MVDHHVPIFSPLHLPYSGYPPFSTQMRWYSNELRSAWLQPINKCKSPLLWNKMTGSCPQDIQDNPTIPNKMILTIFTKHIQTHPSPNN